MLLKELNSINKSIVNSFITRFEAPFQYETGSIKDMNQFLISEDHTLPLIWWVRDDAVNIKSTVKVPMSSMTISTIQATYMIWVDSCIDDNLSERNSNHFDLDDIAAKFITAMEDVKPSIGTLTVSGADNTTNINRTANGLVGVGVSMRVVSPDNIDYCIDCG